MGEANRRKKNGFIKPEYSKEQKALVEGYMLGVDYAADVWKDALENVKGIGEKTREKLYAYVEQKLNERRAIQ